MHPVFDTECQGQPPAALAQTVEGLVARRHAELRAAIDSRQWFDPWIFEADEEEPPAQAQLLWVAGFSAALERYPQLLRSDDPALLEPLAVLFSAFDPEDLEDAEDLLPIIETLQPPQTLAEAAEDLVRSVLLLADVTRPQPGPPTGSRARQAAGPRRQLGRTSAGHAYPGRARRSQTGRRG